LFYYNTALFKKAGISGFPRTWGEFLEAAKKLKSAGITPLSMFTADDAWHATNYLSYFAGGLGGTNVFDIDRPLNSPAIVEAASRLQEAFQYTTQDAIGGKWAVSVQNFVAGNTAVLLDGPWVIGLIDNQMQNPDQVVVAPAPKFKLDDPSLLLTDALTPWSASGRMNKQKEQAVIDFLKHLTSEEISKKFAIDGKLPFVAKMNLTDSERKKAGAKLAADIEYTNAAEQRLVQITRVLKPSVMNEYGSSPSHAHSCSPDREPR
jgi:raffinose/stachyose/melibiose transport system substrate-binding protein